ncbi:MAG: hypothetical protein ACE1Y2_01995, partial [Stenotrophomonas maltophilia]
MSSARRRALFWTLPITLLLLSGLLFAGLVFANQTLNGFGIDSDDDTAPQIALYSGLSDGEPSNDWAAGPDAGSGSGVFQLTPEGSTPTAAEDCYGSNIDFGEINGVAAFICDGHADSALSGGDAGDLADEEDVNIVSGGKQVDDIWTIKNPSGSSGLGTAKSDFSHAYAYLSFGDSCTDNDGKDNDLFLFMAGHRADNEGDAFWGFEFNQRAPDNFSQSILPPDGSTRELNFNRQLGDLLVSGQVQQDDVLFQLFQWDPTDTSQSPLGSYTTSTPVCFPSEELTSNAHHEIEAPPWFIPVCDKTSEGGNKCRLASGDGADTATSNIEMIAPRDFMEVGIDLQAFGIGEQCFANSFIFTSRSSSSLTSSLKDVGGADFHACDANISIAASATNEVGDPHTFIVTVNKVAIGQSTPSVGTEVTVTVSPTPNTITPSSYTFSGCTTRDGEDFLSDGNSDLGRCEVIIESSVAGKFEVSVSADVSVLDGVVTVTTDGSPGNSGPAIKTYVDASIELSPSATNEVGKDHIFVVTVMEDDGSG